MEQKDYWNRAAADKEFTTPFQLDAFEKYVARDALVLDVGCGYGRTLDELYRAGWRSLIGIDFSEAMIERGRAAYPHLDLRVKRSAEKIDLPDESVDAVILFAVLTCIRTNDEQRRLIAEILRVLRPGGILYVNDFLLNADERNTARYEKFKDKYGAYGIFELPECAICRHHDERWIKELLHCFRELEYSCLTFTTMNGHKSNGFYFIGRVKSRD